MRRTLVLHEVGAVLLAGEIQVGQPPPERDCSLHPTRDAVQSRSAVGSERMTGVSEYVSINQMLVAAADAAFSL